MTPINEVPVGKFCRFNFSVVYVAKNDFKYTYTLFPIEGSVPQDKAFNHKVYVYKRLPREWIERANDLVKESNLAGATDNLTYIENLDILKSYGV